MQHRAIGAMVALLAVACDATPDLLSHAEEAHFLRSACEDDAIVALLNASTTTAETLKASGVHSRAANNLIAHRDGLDGVAGTPDDALFASIEEVDAVPYVGDAALEQLTLLVGPSCIDFEPPAANCAETQILDWLNLSITDAEAIKAAGVGTRAANNLVAHRDGADGLPGTGDDNLFDDLLEVDAVPYVGPVTLDTLLTHGASFCPEQGVAQAEVVFSPTSYDESHIQRVIEAVDNARFSIDLAMYSLSDSNARKALIRAAERGVSVRVVYDGASEDRKDPAGTRSAQLEDAGIEVRWINKVMHHKFAIIDGPRQDPSQAETATLISGSANWSTSAATRYDENTVFSTGDALHTLQFQREFNHMWDNSRPVVWNESIAPVEVLAITDAMLVDATGTEAVYTSANFRTYESSRYGHTFSRVRGTSVGREAIIEAIAGATASIQVASGHMRSRQIAEALVAARQADPGLSIEVLLDQQEWVSTWTWSDELADYADCLAAADSANDLEDCADSGLHFGFWLADQGINTRFKTYSYRWDYSYAAQMHHKYLVIDGEQVVSGSYNLSNNAEHATLENISLYSASRYPELVDDFGANFESLWVMGEQEGLYDAYMDQVQNGAGDFPIVFDSMALTWSQVDDLRRAVREACPAVNSVEYREDPAAHRWCER